MSYLIENDKIIFKKYYNLKSGYIADFKGDITIQYNKNKIYLIVSDLREIDEEDLNILPAKLIVLDFKESLLSYQLNYIVLEVVDL